MAGRSGLADPFPQCTRTGTVAASNRKHKLATPNYGYEKRQKELAKKRKKEDKLKQKAERKGPEGENPQTDDDGQPPQDPSSAGSAPPA